MMKSKSMLIAGAVVALFLIAATSRAANIGRTDYVKMDRATALPGVVLAPGAYVFEAIDGHPDIVRVTDRATNRILYQGFTDIVPRPAGVKGVLALGEAASGAPLPINAWFPTGARSGNVFRHR